MTKVCVIGAGGSGLIAASRSIKEGYEVTVYEQCDQAGGIWYYQEKTGVHSAMYEVMVTNLPKELMMYPGVPYPRELPSFMNHQDVLKYMQNYAIDENLPIHYNTKVENVERQGEKWHVTVTHAGETTSSDFDILFVCNGHYSVPSIPFKTADFKGRVLHSHDYRKARDYAGERVLVAGAGNSGIDIALQVGEVAEQVWLVGKKATYPNLPENIEQRITHVEELKDGYAVLSDGTKIEGITSVIVCTGYKFTFPFLSKEIVEIKADGQLVSPLYEHIVHAHYPKSLFFIGIPIRVVTLTLFTHQVLFALQFAKGEVELSKEELLSFEEKRIEKIAQFGRGEGLFHFLDMEQWEYMDNLAEVGKFPKDTEFLKLMKAMYTHLSAIRKADVVNYKKLDYHVKDGCEFEVLKRG